jgi:hypothetical protein
VASYKVKIMLAEPKTKRARPGSISPPDAYHSVRGAPAAGSDAALMLPALAVLALCRHCAWPPPPSSSRRACTRRAGQAGLWHDGAGGRGHEAGAG